MQLTLSLDSSPQDPIVLTASRRLAHALRLAYAEAAQARGLTVWRTPQILPWSTWLRQQFLDARASANSTRPMRVLTGAQSRVLWDDIVAHSPFARHLLNPSSAARLAARSWRRLQDYLIPVDKLASYETKEAQALHAWCVEYERRCAALRAIDESALPLWAHETGLAPEQPVACVGFDILVPAMRRLTERWQRDGLVTDWMEPPRRASQVHVLGANESSAELLAAAQWAQRHVLAGTSRVGVILADLQARRDEVRRVFEDVFAPARRCVGLAQATIPVVIAAPSPLVDYPLADAALLALQLGSHASSNEVGRLLRTPFIGGGVSERGARALADMRLREEQRERWDWFELERWAQMTGCAHLQRIARQLSDSLRAGSGSALASEWAERFQAVWMQCGWPNSERALSSVEFQTVEKIKGVLADFGGLDAIVGKMNLRTAVARLRELFAETQFEPETTSGSVTVIDAATSAGMQFDALWVVGLDADRMPAPANPDTLIPLELQRRAGVPEATAAGVMQVATTQLQRWLAAAREVVFSWPRRQGDAHLQLSPLVAQLGVEPRDAQIDAQASTLSQHLFTARPMLERIVDELAPTLPQPARGGTRTLELQSLCPFRAQAELRLRAQPLPRVSLGVEPIDRGTIFHNVLDEVWRHLHSHARLLETDEATLETFVRESAQRHAARGLMPDTRHRVRLAALEVESVVRQVMRLLQIERERPPFEVEFAEATETYTLGGLTITLRPDRIDALASGGSLLIDYKLGASNWPRDWFDVLPGRPRRPQLPVYALAHEGQLRALSYVVLAPGAVEYRGWSDGVEVGPGVNPYPVGLKIDLGDPPDWPALLHHWRFTLTRLAESYVAGNSQVDPLPHACDTCHLSMLCRIHELQITGGAGDQEGSGAGNGDD